MNQQCLLHGALKAYSGTSWTFKNDAWEKGTVLTFTGCIQCFRDTINKASVTELLPDGETYLVIVREIPLLHLTP